MAKKLLLLLLLINFTGTYAETIRTDVLVVGGTASGVAAAIQSSRSKIKTMLVEPGPWLGGEMTAGGMSLLEGNRTLPSGIWGEFRKRVRDFYKNTPGVDTAYNAQLRFEPYTGAAILKRMCDTVKNLTLHLNTPFTALKKDGDIWELTVTLNGKPTIIRAKVLVDATPTGDIAALAGAKFDIGFDSRQETGEALAPEKALPIIEDITWVAIVKQYALNSAPLVAKPQGYNAALYSGLKASDIQRMLNSVKLPNDKYMIKWEEYANTFGATPEELSPEHRDTYYKSVRLRTLGLIYYLQNDLGLKNIGLDEQAFGSPDHLAYIPYIREYRRAKGMVRMGLNEIYNPYANTLYRTSIGVGDAGFGKHYSDPTAPKTDYPPLPAYSIPLGAVVSRDITNLLITEKAMSTTHLTNASTFYPSVQMTIGQGVGAAAAYCVFFNKTTKNLDVRAIQGEIMDYKGFLYPYADIPTTDKYFRAIQQITATGLIKTVHAPKGRGATQVLFKADSTVSTAAIKPILLEIYTRAFIWFSKNKPAETFTIADMLSFISDQTLTEPKTLELTLRKQWKETYGFSKDFDPARPVTRYEFAVLMNKYINPFKTKVDLNGKVVN